MNSSETPSRLKGIETLHYRGMIRLSCSQFRNAFPFEGNRNILFGGERPRVKFRNAFPFEGNRNTFNWGAKDRADIEFRNAFPFEGNRNSTPRSHQAGCRRSETPSRLKGIETPLAFFLVDQFIDRSETPSRLKGIETLLCHLWVLERSVKSLCSETPSRLKGIETAVQAFGNRFKIHTFRNAFPFEGNRNQLKPFYNSFYGLPVQKRLPV